MIEDDVRALAELRADMAKEFAELRAEWRADLADIRATVIGADRSGARVPRP